MNQGDYLSILARAPAGRVKAFAEELIPALEPIAVLVNRTGLVMLPMRDTAQGTLFYLGEVLVAEAHVRAGGTEGYALCLGRDLEQALAIALIDAAATAELSRDTIAAFVAELAEAQAREDTALAGAVAQTKVDLETF